MITKLKVEQAIGKPLLHDLIGSKNGKKCTIFKRGHIITEGDIETLKLNGKSHINILTIDDGSLLHEEDAAKLFGAKFSGKNISLSAISEGKVSFISNVDGFVMIDKQMVYKVNCFDKVSFATKKSCQYVKKGEVIASFRIVELFYDKSSFEELLKLNDNLINVEEIDIKRIALITVGSEIYHGLKQDLSLEKVNARLIKYNIQVSKHLVCDDDEEMLTNLITDCYQNYDTVFCIGGMSVDADDITAATIEKFCDSSIYGTPIIPGSVFLIGNKQEKYVLGLPANVIFAPYTAFDVFLPYVLTNTTLTKSDIAKYGYGGLR